MKAAAPRVERWLLLGALGPVLLALAVQVFAAGVRESAAVAQSAERRLVTLSHLTASLAAPALEFDDERSLSEVLQSVSLVPDFAGAVVLRADGGVAASAGLAPTVEGAWGTAAEPVLSRQAGSLTAVQRITQQGHTLGAVAISLDTRASVAEARWHVARAALISLGAGGIAVAVVLWLVRTVRRRSERIEHDRLVLKQTGELARVGGWELLLPAGEFRLSDEARRVLKVAAVPAEVMRLIAFRERALVTCVDEGTPFEIEVPLPQQGRPTLWFRVQGEAERSHGVTQRVFGAIQDVTAEHGAREEALAASRAKSQFLANTSHEMRTPLNGILGMATLALETQLSDEQRAHLEAIELSGRTLLATVNDLLDISRIEAGKLTLEALPLDLEDLVVESTRLLSVQATAKDVRLIVTVSPGVELRRRGDPLRVAQIVTNLVGNAVKFTPQGEIEVTIAGGGDEVTLSVRDTGIGVTADRQRAIFDAFTQSDGSTTRRYGGTGLGLTITRELARLMGGDVSLTSAPGVGSTFTARLALPAAPQLRAVTAPPIKRALVVGPSVAACRSTRLLLERLGVEVEAVSSVEAARDLPGPFDVALLDGSLAQDQVPAAARRLWLVPFGLPRPGHDDQEYVAMPVTARQLSALLEPRRRDTTGPPTPRSGRSLNVLLAEDNRINATVARAIVEKEGHRVVHAWNGREALEALEHDTFELVLMDVQMPELDGLETTRRIRERERTTHQHLYIIAMTANARKADEASCLEAGMDGFLAKPIDVKALRALLAERAAHAQPVSAS